MCSGGSGKDGVRLVAPRFVKEDFGATTQAGDGDVLIDQAKQVVYYDARIDQNYYTFFTRNL